MSYWERSVPLSYCSDPEPGRSMLAFLDGSGSIFEIAAANTLILRDNPWLKRAVPRHHIVDKLTLSGVVGTCAWFDNRWRERIYTQNRAGSSSLAGSRRRKTNMGATAIASVTECGFSETSERIRGTSASGFTQLSYGNDSLRQEEGLRGRPEYEGIVGQSSALRHVLEYVEKVATSDSTVLLLGETGTGKELIARAIHSRSRRKGRPMVTVNCAAIPSDLLESELFGHERGAFTGAAAQRIGRFELADRGTLFLDEIGDIPLQLQSKLLRVMQEQEFERLGSTSTRKVDIRIVAATNQNLEMMMEENQFRSDLYYRLNVFPIELPPLRERGEDIVILLHYFVDRHSRKIGKQFEKITQRTLDLFRTYDWPGNIRELQNVVERAVILCEGETFSVGETFLQRKSNPLSPRPLSSPGVFAEAKEKFADRERELIEAALAECQGRVSGPHGAAAKLGIPRTTLEWKIADLGVDKRRYTAM
jgi:formate hydrogenlyase transcriptional activator